MPTTVKVTRRRDDRCFISASSGQDSKSSRSTDSRDVLMRSSVTASICRKVAHLSGEDEFPDNTPGHLPGHEVEALFASARAVT